MSRMKMAVGAMGILFLLFMLYGYANAKNDNGNGNGNGNNGQQQAEQARQQAERQAEQARRQAEQEAEQARQQAEQARLQAERQAEQARQQVEQQAEQARQQAEQARQQAAQQAEQARQQAERQAEQAKQQAGQQAEQVRQQAERQVEQAKSQSQQNNNSSLDRAQKRSNNEDNERAKLHAANSEQNQNNNSGVEARNNKGNNRHIVESDRKVKESVERVAKAVGALEHARWSYNPHDTRGQGNMGKVDMRNPYGFDKYSGREGKERGRPTSGTEPVVDEPQIEEPAVNEPIVEQPVTVEPVVEEPVATEPLAEELAAINWEETLNIDFSSLEEVNQFYWNWYQSVLNSYYTSSWGQQYYTYDQWQKMWYDHFFKSGEDYVGIIISHGKSSIDYDLTLADSGTYEITTSLVSRDDYNSYIYNYEYDPITGTWKSTREDINYDAGEVITTQTQQVTIDENNNTYSYSYVPPSDISGYTNIYTELQVTVTDVDTGQSYTTTYDKALYLFRCPYGKVYNAKTKQPVIGAKVTVYNEDGSIVSLDKASNPTASNPQTTDATGRYGVKLQTGGKYYIVATAPGYEEYKSPTFTEKWHILREDIGLAPKQNLAVNMK